MSDIVEELEAKRLREQEQKMAEKSLQTKFNEARDAHLEKIRKQRELKTCVFKQYIEEHKSEVWWDDNLGRIRHKDGFTLSKFGHCEGTQCPYYNLNEDWCSRLDITRKEWEENNFDTSKDNVTTIACAALTPDEINAFVTNMSKIFL